MSCLTTSATRRSRRVPAAVLIASAAASSHEVLLVPMISVTLYTLIVLSFDHVRPSPRLLPPACHRVTPPVIDAGRWLQARIQGPGPPLGRAARAPWSADRQHHFTLTVKLDLVVQPLELG